MTTLVALATKDALVMGCDSLGSVTLQMVDPFDLAKEFFDPEQGWKLKTDEHGNPVLKEFRQLYDKSQSVPFNHMTHVTKMFSLDPLEMGVLTTGIASIGERTIKSLIKEFKTKDRTFVIKPKKPTNFTVKSIAEKLLAFINRFYLKTYPQESVRPDLEFMIGGYDKQKQVPTIYRIYVNKNSVEAAIEDTFGISFGGQMQEIQRIVFGTDNHNRINLIKRFTALMELYKTNLQKLLDEKGVSVALPDAPSFGDELYLLNKWDLDGFDANWGDFSEQNAIECVDWFVEIMIKSQQFSSRLPTVGGDVHIALITKDKGFRFISKEEYEHEGHFTEIERQ